MEKNDAKEILLQMAEAINEAYLFRYKEERFADYAMEYCYQLEREGKYTGDWHFRLLVNSREDIKMLEWEDSTIPQGYLNAFGFEIFSLWNRPRWMTYYVPGIGLWDEETESWKPINIKKDE